MENKSYGYVSGYEPKPIQEQITELRKLFPNITNVNEQLLQCIKNNPRHMLPHLAEGWFAIPSFKCLAPSYELAVHKVINLLKEQRECQPHAYEKYFGSTYLRERNEKIQALSYINDKQNADILLIPGQFGIRFSGQMLWHKELPKNEFGLGIYELSIMLLTHPLRFNDYFDLHVVGLGDDFDPEPKEYNGLLGFSFDGSGVNFTNTHYFDGKKHAFKSIGLATGFIV